MNWILTDNPDDLLWTFEFKRWRVRWMRDKKGRILYYDYEDDIGL